MNAFAFSGLSVTIPCAVLALALLYFGRTKLHRSAMVFNVAVALWGFGLFLAGIAREPAAAILGWKIGHAGGFLVAPTFYYFVVTFCGIDRRKMLAIAWCQALLFLSLLGTDLLFSGTRFVHGLHYVVPDTWYHPGLLLYLFFVLAGYGELFRFLPSSRGRKRSQALYITFGFLFGFAGGSLTFLPMYGINLFFSASNLGITLYCLIIGYAILRHRILDIHIAFKKSLAYALSAGFLTGLFILLVLLSTRFVSETMGVSSFTITVFSALAIAVMFAPLKNGIQSSVDRIFFRDSYDYYDVVQTTSRELLSSVDLEQTCRLVVDTIFETLSLDRALLLRAVSGGYETAYAVPGSAPLRLSADTPLMNHVVNLGIVLREELAEMQEEGMMAASDLASLGCDAAVPILVDGEPKYVLLLGEKLTGDSYSPEDLKLLGTLSNQAAIALKNASLFAELSGALEQVRTEVSERARAESALREAADNWRATFDSTTEAIMLLDGDLTVAGANRSASTFFDTPVEPQSGQRFLDFFQGRASLKILDQIGGALRSGRHEELVVHFRKEDRWIHASFDPLRDATGHITHGAVCTLRDMTEEKRLQAQISQSRKMESVGRLAGGVAHDFNNLMFTIIGFSQLAQRELGEDSPQTKKLKMVVEAAEKASGLTRQLLAFSRKQVLEIKDVDLLETVNNMTKILSRTIGEDIEIEIRGSAVLKSIKADPVQVEQVIMNLALNARDAMPEGGRLLMQVGSEAVADVPGERPGIPVPGEYVVFSVTDTGEGMTREVQDRVFEPFFTTKEVGKGTGLGLATVYGIVKQHNSYITVISSPGEGATFKIYFPSSETAEGEKVEGPAPAAVPTGTETVMVVEDDTMVLAFVLETLGMLGYRLLSAQNGEEALEKIRSADCSIDLLITDVVMPKMNGKELAVRLEHECPDIKVLYMSGYPDEIIGRHGVLDGGEIFIQKPATPSELAMKVREVLDGPPSGS